MNQIVGSIWWLIVSLGILVTFHEFGHFWVARKVGVRVLRFSVGFGRPLWRRTAKSGTEYQVAMIPLGGYVKFLDEYEGDVPPEQVHEAFNRQSVWRRFAIVAAGPLFNLILCVFLLWSMHMLGKSDRLPYVGETTGIAAESGLHFGDRILSVDGKPVPTWSHVYSELVIAAIDHRNVELSVQRDGGAPREETLQLSKLPADFDQTNPIGATGLTPRWTYATVGGFADDSPAKEAGLRQGDQIIGVNGTAVSTWGEMSKAIAANPEGQALSLLVRRDGGSEQIYRLQPRLDNSTAKPRWIIGITQADATVRRMGPIDAMSQAFADTRDLTAKSLGMIGRLLTGAASVQNMSGPITIAKGANATASIGMDWYLYFLAVISLSLCIMNLLPIPILDGGHLLYYLIEIIKGSPVSERVLIAGQYVGLALLAGLMGLAFYVDLAR